MSWHDGVSLFDVQGRLHHEILNKKDALSDAGLQSDAYTGSSFVSLAVHDDMLMAVLDDPGVFMRFRVFV